MASQDDINLSRFVQKLGEVIQYYVKGYYFEARYKSSQLLIELENTDSWEEHISRAWDAVLKDWDAGAAFRHIDDALNSLKDPSELIVQPQVLYSFIFKGWIGCSERMNATHLREAERSLSLASRLWERLNRQYGEAFQKTFGPFAHPFLPPLTFRPWVVYWLRGNVRSALGKRSDSLQDFRHAAHLLTYAAIEAHGIPIDENQGLDEKTRGGLKSFVLGYGTQSLQKSPVAAKVVGRFYNDLGIFLFENGDFRTATESLIRASAFDEENPYYLSNLGFILMAYNQESKAIVPLVGAYKLAEQAREMWNRNAWRPIEAGEYYVSGRIYYHLGLLIYKWLRDRNSIHPDRQQDILESLSNGDGTTRELFDEARNMHQRLFRTSSDYYIRMRDIMHALPALILLRDPLRDIHKPDGMMRTARRLLWELSYGMGDFTSEMTEHRHLMQSYLAPELT